MALLSRLKQPESTKAPSRRYININHKLIEITVNIRTLISQLCFLKLFDYSEMCLKYASWMANGVDLETCGFRLLRFQSLSPIYFLPFLPLQFSDYLFFTLIFHWWDTKQTYNVATTSLQRRCKSRSVPCWEQKNYKLEFWAQLFKA